jgi:hypothetical protein
MYRRHLPLLLALLSPTALGQSFVQNTLDIPTGNPANNSTTENVDFADVDSDGDLDAMFADGGNDGNDRNRLWINLGGLQGGTVGVFDDQTGTRLPVGTSTSRDVEFVDIDGDGDVDVYTSNTSTASNQTNRWWVNQGGLQAGTAGFFVDETDTRWVNLGQNNGSTTFSSVPMSFVLPGGAGFIDWSCDCDFADLDNDGDQDLIHASYGDVFGGATPTRLFLNDGGGLFEEYNPSGFQLTSDFVLNGNPALWASGTQQASTMASNGTQADIAATTTDLEPGDIDGDLDIDFVLGARNEQPRMFQNRLEENGGTLAPFRDVTSAVFPAAWAPGFRHYEQEFGDLDGDDDLDLYGVNWEESMSSADDVTMANDGAGVFGSRTLVPASSVGDVESDFIDYDQDGDLDVAIASNDSVARLYRNDLAGSWSLVHVTATELPAVTGPSLDVEAGDVDNDGDTDLFLARDDFMANVYLENVTQTADTTAPRIPLVEQAPDRTSSATPTVVRAHVYDNGPYYATWYNATALEYSVDGGGFTPVPMVSSGAQVFRGEIPGALVGTIGYRVRSTDAAGNVGLSTQLSYAASAGCGSPVSYCTAGVSNSGCQAVLSSSGTPSATASSGFSVIASSVEGSKDGLFFFGTSGRQANTWGNGTSFQCVVPPVKRGGLLSGSGTSGLCNGGFTQDLNALWCPSCPKPAKNPGAGTTVQAQLWYRDPQNTSNQTTSLSDAIEFTVQP